MAALVIDRILRIQLSDPPESWCTSDFQSAIADARSSWQLIEELFNIQYPMLGDAVAQIAPAFKLEHELEEQIAASEIANSFIGKQIAMSFLKWELCQKTDAVDNPYDPLIQIFEHGGNLNKEHGQFIDVFDNHGKMVCGVTVRRA